MGAGLEEGAAESHGTLEIQESDFLFRGGEKQLQPCILDEDLEKGKRVLGNNFLISTILYIPGHASLFPTLPGVQR